MQRISNFSKSEYIEINTSVFNRNSAAFLLLFAANNLTVICFHKLSSERTFYECCGLHSFEESIAAKYNVQGHLDFQNLKMMCWSFSCGLLF